MGVVTGSNVIAQVTAAVVFVPKQCGKRISTFRSSFLPVGQSILYRKNTRCYSETLAVSDVTDYVYPSIYKLLERVQNKQQDSTFLFCLQYQTCHMILLSRDKEQNNHRIGGMTKYRKECSFRERKIFIRKEHFITLLSALNSFQCHFIH